MVGGEQDLAELRSGMRKFPQTLINVRTEGGTDVMDAPQVKEAVASVERELGDSGRVLLRPSGTEPLIRVMVEGQDEGKVAALARQIADQVEVAARSCAA